MNLHLATAAFLFLSAVGASAVNAATLIGTEITYCIDSIRAPGDLSNDPAQCESSEVSPAGTTTIVDPGVEIVFPPAGTRDLDFFASSLNINYNQPMGSASPDLFVITGLGGITSIMLGSANVLDVEWIYSGDALGVLVNAPLEVGTVALNFELGVIPEPASWAMLIAGFGLVGLAMRRQRMLQA